ncbi:MAG: hypothetical protein HY074_14475, partial [Deltaproteobacteria bacterium]|nr:hypothetical protein [Deltaproteobacteria bacterium]
AGLPQFSKFLWDRYEITAAGDGERYHWRLRLSYFTVGNLIFHCAVAGIFLVAADRVILLPLLVFSSLLLPAAVFLQADGFLRALEYRLHS